MGTLYTICTHRTQYALNSLLIHILQIENGRGKGLKSAIPTHTLINTASKIVRHLINSTLRFDRKRPPCSIKFFCFELFSMTRMTTARRTTYSSNPSTHQGRDGQPDVNALTATERLFKLTVRRLKDRHRDSMRPLSQHSDDDTADDDDRSSRC